MRCDKQGHPLAHWDDHSACRFCLKEVGIVCSRLTPCIVCQSWTIEMWEAFEDAELQSAQKRERRRRAREAKEAAASARRASSHETLSGEAHASTQGRSKESPEVILRRQPYGASAYSGSEMRYFAPPGHGPGREIRTSRS